MLVAARRRPVTLGAGICARRGYFGTDQRLIVRLARWCEIPADERIVAAHRPESRFH